MGKINAEVDEETTDWFCSVNRRERGVYLAHWYEQRDGTESWDAFSTLAAAKRWCAAGVGVNRLPWREQRPGLWFAEVEA